MMHPNGLFAAANSPTTGYHRIWIRDNIYTLLGFESEGRYDVSLSAVHALINILKRHENKIDWMIKQPHPKEKWRYIHPRYDPNGNEVLQDWGNKQNDAIGALLWKIGDLDRKGKMTWRAGDKEIVQKLVHYLEAIEYWHDEDNGMWEENEEVHSSSIGACLAGLLAVQHIVNVPLHLIANGEHALRTLLPRESLTKETDLTLLSLIWPYNVVTAAEREQILFNIETKLLRNKGVIRYVGDKYYNNGMGEPSWTMGLPWLSIIYRILGDKQKHYFYLNKTREAANEKDELPELYYAETSVHNENTPLLWAMSLWKVAENE